MEPTRHEDFHYAFHQYAKQHGKAAATHLLKSITGEDSPENVHEGLYESFVIAARREKIRPAAKDMTASPKWKKIQEAVKNAKGHINVNSGFKRDA